MRGGVFAELVGLFADGGQLIHVERRTQGEAGARASAGCGNLDEVGAFLDELTDGGATLVRASGLDTEVAQVASDDRHGSPGEYQPRRRHYTHLYGIAQQEGRAVLRAAVANGGDARV